LNLNTADSLALINIKGIGAKTAHVILNLRNKLGGFTSIDQVLTSESIYYKVKDAIKERCSVDGPVNGLNIIALDVHAISSHPYISEKQAVYLKNNVHVLIKGKYPEGHEVYFDNMDWHKVLPYFIFD